MTTGPDKIFSWNGNLLCEFYEGTDRDGNVIRMIYTPDVLRWSICWLGDDGKKKFVASLPDVPIICSS